ncbi:ATP-dependent Clp protease adaptor protein ClpS [bacterium BMS3Abin03]|nr:ATP-dependent Clp protease adaptor protein ClpS [bacterium BMS3Abin03]
METPIQENPEVEIYEEERIDAGLESRVMLYNDDWHTFDEVILQLIKATGCSYDEARSKAFEVHIKGMATVYNGEFKDCLRVSSILEEIALHTQIVT